MEEVEDHPQDSSGAQQFKQRTLSGEFTEDRAANQTEYSNKGHKLQRIIRKYDMVGYGEEIAKKYTKSGKHRKSLRDLEEEINTKILDRATRDVPQITHEDYEDCVDRLCSNDRKLTKKKLDDLGVDGAEILEDMLTYETVRGYLMHHQNTIAELERTKPKDTLQIVKKLENKVLMVVSNALERQYDRGNLPAAPMIETVIRADCPECGAEIAVTEYLRLKTCPNCLFGTDSAQQV